MKSLTNYVQSLFVVLISFVLSLFAFPTYAFAIENDGYLKEFNVNIESDLDSQLHFIIAEESEWFPYINTQTSSKVFDCNNNGVFETNFCYNENYNLYVLQFKNDGKINYSSNIGRFDQNWFDVLKDGDILNYKYRINIDQTNNFINLSINKLGCKNIVKDTVLQYFGDCLNFASVSETLTIKGDSEGNFATNNLKGNGEIGITSSVTQFTKETNISVYVESEETEKDFNLNLINKNTKELVDSVELTTDIFGSSEHTFSLNKEAFTQDDTFYIEADLSEENDIISSDIAIKEDAMMGTENLNYAKFINANVNGKNINNDYIVSCSDSYNGRDLNLITITEEEFDETINISNRLNSVKELSILLNEALDNEDYEVYTISAKDLNGNRINIESNNSKDVIINVNIPYGSSEFVLNPDTLHIGKVNLVDGKTWDEFASKIIWNFVYDNGDPYNGIVKTTRTVKGTIVLPLGTYIPNSSSPALIVANEIIQGNGEFHKLPYNLGKTKNYSLSLYTDVVEIEDEDVPLEKLPGNFDEDIKDNINDGEDNKVDQDNNINDKDDNINNKYDGTDNEVNNDDEDVNDNDEENDENLGNNNNGDYDNKTNNKEDNFIIEEVTDDIVNNVTSEKQENDLKTPGAINMIEDNKENFTAEDLENMENKISGNNGKDQDYIKDQVTNNINNSQGLAQTGDNNLKLMLILVMVIIVSTLIMIFSNQSKIKNKLH